MTRSFFMLLYFVHLYFSCELETCKSLANCPNPKTENAILFNSVCINDGTEKAWTGKYENEHYEGNGVYYCACCGNPLFPLKALYDSGSGWPSFWAPYNDQSVEYQEDLSCLWCGKRVAVECGKCGIHLGHVFDDGPPPTYKRYCMNSVCLNYGDAPANDSNWLSSDYYNKIPKNGFTMFHILIFSGVVAVIILGIGAFIFYKRMTSSEGFARLSNDTEEGGASLQEEVEHELENQSENDCVEDKENVST